MFTKTIKRILQNRVNLKINQYKFCSNNFKDGDPNKKKDSTEQNKIQAEKILNEQNEKIIQEKLIQKQKEEVEQAINQLNNEDKSNKKQENQQEEIKQDDKNQEKIKQDHKKQEEIKQDDKNQEKMKQDNQKDDKNQEENKQDDNKQDDKKHDEQKQQKKEPNGFLVKILLLTTSYYLIEQMTKSIAYEIQYTEFLSMIEKNKIKQIIITNEINSQSDWTHAKIISEDNTTYILKIKNINNFLENIENYQIQKSLKIIPIKYDFKQSNFDDILFSQKMIFFGLSMGLTFYIFKNLSRGSGDIMQSIIGSKKWKTADKKSEIKFLDVAGQDEAKKEISEFVDFLKFPEKYHELGARLPKGALLTGPPGTGKTLLAKACAGEAGVPFFYLSGSDFVEMFVGVGAQRVRDLFKQAKQKSPSIIFIDEIDAIGKKRQGSRNEERDNTLNQLLVEMDGFDTDKNVIVMAATNRSELLDAALLRPGRFDRQIEVTLPDLEGRYQIFKVHLKPLKLEPSKSLEDQAKRLATLTPGFSGADISNLCNESAILAARNNKAFVESDDFERATERILAGYEKTTIIGEKDKNTVAYHESGHAVVSWFLKGGSPLLKLTIIPRSKGSLGFAQYLPNESSLYTQQELEDQICVALGGRISEEHFFKQITTGASDDLQKIHKIAEAIVTKFGMSDDIGYVGYKDPQYYRHHSEDTQKIIDDEIFKLVNKCTIKTRQIIQQYEKQINELSLKLIEKETLNLQQIIEILGPRPFEPKSNYKEYLNTRLAEQ